MKTQIVKWGICFVVVAGLAGCAGKAKGPSDEEMIKAQIDEAMMALKAQDIEKMSMYYADDFSSEQGDKAAMITFLQGAKDGGFLESATSSTDGMVVEVMGETAKAGPVTLSLPNVGADPLALHFELGKRNGAWMVTSQTQQ